MAEKSESVVEDKKSSNGLKSERVSTGKKQPYLSKSASRKKSVPPSYNPTDKEFVNLFESLTRGGIPDPIRDDSDEDPEEMEEEEEEAQQPAPKKRKRRQNKLDEEPYEKSDALDEYEKNLRAQKSSLSKKLVNIKNELLKIELAKNQK